MTFTSVMLVTQELLRLLLNSLTLTVLNKPRLLHKLSKSLLTINLQSLVNSRELFNQEDTSIKHRVSFAMECLLTKSNRSDLKKNYLQKWTLKTRLTLTLDLIAYFQEDYLSVEHSVTVKLNLRN